ncbi:MAG: glutamate racemase [Candidatus Omnitrophica bacterium]|jgi:glutamate racemase|nr:glutamate racemase [Candidatus Omnitrophota bacterium]
MENKAIGIFDSGVGGLTVLKEVERLLPNEDIIYFGDTARVPYGNKSKSTIIKFSTENILFLLKKKVKIIVIACNTASSLALDSLKDIFSVPLIGVVEAGAAKALKVSKNRKIAVVGTRSTINSKSYEKAILKNDKTAKIYSKACPLFVPLVEEGILEGVIAKSIIEMYLKSFKSAHTDVIILGCTHYPLLKRQIAAYLKGVYIVDSATEVALHARGVLMQHNLLRSKNNKTGKREFYVTDEPKAFMRHAGLFLKRKIPLPKVINNLQ